MSVLILPVAVVIAFFSPELLLFWTHNAATANATHRLLSILICGTAINGLMNFPYALQLAFGWTALSVYKNVVAVILVVPMIVYMAVNYGAIGAAGVWLVLNLGYLFLEIPIMHRRLLRTEQWRWYWQDVGLPLSVSVLVAAAWRAFMGGSMSQLGSVLYLLAASMTTLGLTALATPVTRAWLLSRRLPQRP